MEEERFSMSLPLLIEYGTYRLHDDPPLEVTRLHQSYPNISRLSVRAHSPHVRLFVHSLSGQPAALPMLRILAVGNSSSPEEFSGVDKLYMTNDVFKRNMASSVKMELCFDGMVRLPLYFAIVRASIYKV